MIDAQKISQAVSVLSAGGVIAYPTEYCFGLGCDPKNGRAVERILDIKQRHKKQGVILIAANLDQVEQYAELDSVPDLEAIRQSWPGPNTWVLPVKESVSTLIKGHHSSIAMRIPGYDVCRHLCQEFGHAIVSTSANRHGQEALLNYSSIVAEFDDELDYVVDLPIQITAQAGDNKASTIRDAISGKILR